MASRKTYGNTWWGKAWIDALTNIDYNENRLPRGRTYANTGKVIHIEITNDTIIARVQGTRPSPYKIKINLIKFSENEKKAIFNILKNNIDIASELSMGKLPPSLLDIMNKNRVNLLPKKWEEINADCSCPDWANPCKHLAAVYYIIANEVDKNPFLLFNLKGITTDELIKASGLSNKVIDVSSNENYDDGFVQYNEIKLPEIKTPLQLKEPSFDFQKVDIKSLFALLPDNPPFYDDGNFKEILLSIYNKAESSIDAIPIIDKAPNLKNINFHIFYDLNNKPYVIIPKTDKMPDEIVMLVKKKEKMSIPKIEEGKITFENDIGNIVSLEYLIQYFLKIPFDISNDNNSPSSRFISYIVSLSLAVIRSFSYVPEVFFLKEKVFDVRYVPIIHDDKLKDEIEYAKTLVPPTFMYKLSDKSILPSDKVKNILSLFVTEMIYYFVSNQFNNGNKLIDLFTTNNVYHISSFEESNTAKSISKWFERLYIRKKDLSLLIKINITEESEQEINYNVSVDAVDNKNPIGSNVPLKELFRDNVSKIFSIPIDVVRTDISRQLTLAGEYMPTLKNILKSKGMNSPKLSSTEMSNVLTNVSGIFDLLGIKMLFPKELQKLSKPQIMINATTKKANKNEVSYLSLGELLSFSYEIALGDQRLSQKEFLNLVKSAKGLIKYKDQFVLLDPDEINKIIKRIEQPIPEMTTSEAIFSALSGEVSGLQFNPDERLKELIDDLKKVKEIKPPKSLNATLRPYQERGYKWLYSNMDKNFGSCIADDMGLGKTIQVIALLLKLKEQKKLQKPSLVICPTTLIGNWKKECEKFAPSLQISIYHGTNRKLTLKGSDLIITSYGTLRNDLSKFKAKEWSILVIDEAQNIKNTETDQTKAVKSVKADSYIAMTGTPVENRLTELWSIFDFINKGYLGNLKNFRTNFSIPIEKYRDKKQMEKLKISTSPFVLRRLKSDKSIIKDLPDKIMFDEYCYLTKEQTALYKATLDGVMEKIEKSEGIERKGLVLQLITRLKQICNHPIQYTKKGTPNIKDSGKAEKMRDIIENVLDEKEKLLIFTQYKEMGDLLVDMIKEEFNENAMFFHGSVTRIKRDKMVEEFQTSDDKKIMIISLKAGGVGLNLTRATNVIHYDLWWNPAVENQATDRAFRIGQTKNVIVHRLITIGTFEEKIDEIIKSKKELADMIVGEGEKTVTEMSNAELKEIFSLSKELS